MKNLFSVFVFGTFLSQCSGFDVKDKAKVSTHFEFSHSGYDMYMRHANKPCDEIESIGPIAGGEKNSWGKWVMNDDGTIRTYSIGQQCPRCCT
jgi:hypothetical protein